MSPLGQSTSRRREAAIRTARRRIQRLEIETHRIKAELARLEADNENDLADELTHDLRVGDATAAGKLTTESRRLAVDRPNFHRGSTTGVAVSTRNRALSGVRGIDPATHPRQPAVNRTSPTIVVTASGTTGDRGRPGRDSRRKGRAWLTPAWTLSLGLHIAVLLVGGLATYATLAENNLFLLASPHDFADETIDEFSEIEVETVVADELEPAETFADNPQFEIGESLLESLTPVWNDGGFDSADQAGLVGGLPSDVGTLLSGGGKGEPSAGQVGSASFFGTRSEGSRFVFVVDNSSSMKGGRLDAAVAELARCIEAMTRKQSFYVIFVSDQPYPMFYPAAERNLLSATAANKKRLGEWLGRVQLASGKNRELITAMDLAASLRPDAVFLLWDGDMRYSARVRRDVVQHLTGPELGNVKVHTLGMGVESLDSEHGLTAIAAAHGGTYRPIRVATPGDRRP